MIKGVIFDMDGLMFDTERVWATLWAPALKQFGMDTVPEGLDEAARGAAGENLRAVIRRYCGENIDAQAVYELLVKLGNEAFRSGVEKKPGLDALLAWLSAQGVPMAVASSSPEQTIRRNLETSGTAKYFPVVVAGNHIRNSKPDPEIFLLAAQKIGVAPGECLVLEDSYNGVRAGHAGGFITVMVPDILPPDDEMRRTYTACCASLDEVLKLLKAGRLG